MELDTGAARTLISKSTFDSVFSGSSFVPKVHPSSLNLRKFGDTPIPIFGETTVMVKYHNLSRKLPLVITRENGPSLLGRNWFKSLNFNFSDQIQNSSSQVNSIATPSLEKRVLKLSSKFVDLFKSEVGTFKPHKVSIDLDSSVSPRFYKARPVPFHLKEKIDQELDRLESEGIIEAIPHAEWACPIVPVVKPNGKIRICGDYKITANKAMRMDSYPVPKPYKLLSSLAGGKVFAKLDMSHAYNQLQLDDASQPCTTINTHRGLFKYKRLCFGVSTAPGVFQRTMETLLKGLQHVVVFFDDILITGNSAENYLSNIEKVLNRLQDAGLRLNMDKCKWCLNEVTYLSFRVSADGIKPTNEKLVAIRDAPEPKNKTELQSYLGLLNFYRMFLPNASSFLEPLNFLLRAENPWKWTKAQSQAFQKSKDVLLSSKCLVHFDPNKPIVVSADSSSYGIGSCLAHVIDGKECPVFFASRTLNSAERNYSQIEREALALVYALKKFHFYLYGHSFTLKTDHKPLLGLFNPDKHIPLMASDRIQRWCLMLQAYSFKLVHTSGKLLGNVDALSRLPLSSVNESIPVPAEWVNTVQFFNATQVNAFEIGKSVRSDSILSHVYNFCFSGWPNKLPNDLSSLQPYFQRRNELTLQSNCILWGNRVLIPSVFRSTLLSELHSEHLGMTKMKQLARSYFWWPGLDSDIEQLVRTCNHCLETRNEPPKAELHPWSWPTQVWHRIHIDYCGPLHGYYYLIVVDATSKWVEVFKTKYTTSTVTISLLRTCFSQFGIPVVLVSDNAQNFKSHEFESYLQSLGVKHLPTAIHSPHMNGQAERIVEIFKDRISDLNKGGDVQEKIDKFLFKYRLTPHAITGISPSELMFGRRIRCVFDLVRPHESIQDRVIANQARMKKYSDPVRPRKLDLKPQDKVLVRNYGIGSKWTNGTIKKKTGPVTYDCELDDGSVVLRHQNQLWRNHRAPHSPSSSISADDLVTPPSSPSHHGTPAHDPNFSPPSHESSVSSGQRTPPSPNVLSRPHRVIRPPRRLDL